MNSLLPSSVAAPDVAPDFPSELKKLNRWLVHDKEKRPYSTTAERMMIDPLDPQNWDSYANALIAIATRKQENLGLGIALGDGLTGVDFDGCVNDGVIREDIQQILTRVDSYAEFSPSGRGVHIFVTGWQFPVGDRKGRKAGSAEIYSADRYFTVSGKHVPSTPATVNDRNLDWLYERIVVNREFADITNAVQSTQRVKAGKLDILSAGSIVSKKPFLLAYGEDELPYESQSDADFALCSILAKKFDGDPAKIDEAFRKSPLYREKWERLDYRERTLERAGVVLASPRLGLETYIRAAAFAEGRLTKRVYDYDELIPHGYFVLWLGARKAEKSLFALRKSMHDACGKDWFRYRNTRGPVDVLYFDTENDDCDIQDRYTEIIQEFSPDEQRLIRANLQVVSGTALKKNGVDIEWTDSPFWQGLATEHANAQVVYLDCFYQLHSERAADNQRQKRALEFFESIFPERTIFLLHHTGRESDESLQKKKPNWLRIIGPERWSNKCSGGSVITKKAELIFCQERYQERDREGYSCIDFQTFGRSSEESPLMSFEVDYGNGAEPFKYRRQQVLRLSALAASVLQKLRGRGPWKSKYAIGQESGGVGGRNYRAISELIGKGALKRKSDGTYIVVDAEAGDAQKPDQRDPLPMSASKEPNVPL